MRGADDKRALMFSVLYHLVAKVHQWPGVNGYANLMSGRPLRATRPRHFFRNPGPMPETITLPLTIPPELGPVHEVLEELRVAVEAVERTVAEERQRSGRRLLGRRGVLQQSWRESPTSIEPRRNLRPRFAASNPASRIAALLGYREFIAVYRDARRSWLAGLTAVFPRGTYWLRRFAAVPVFTTTPG